MGAGWFSLHRIALRRGMLGQDMELSRARGAAFAPARPFVPEGSCLPPGPHPAWHLHGSVNLARVEPPAPLTRDTAQVGGRWSLISPYGQPTNYPQLSGSRRI